MIIGGRRTSFFLFSGDIVAFVVSLYLTLWIRYLEIPSEATLSPYLIPFTFLFAFWTLVFYSAGLYSKRLALFPSRLSDALFKTQMANILFAALLGGLRVNVTRNIGAYNVCVKWPFSAKIS